jgi:phosphatidylglycerol:prolipoprotein diacylglycerol transferase
MLAAIALCAFLARTHAPELERRRVYGALSWAWLGALLGARVLTMIANLPDAIITGNSTLVWRGGLTAYGGFLGGTLAAWLALGRRDLLLLGDLMAPSLGLGTCITRIGCFLAGCDFGRVTTSRWGVRFPPASPAYEAHARRGWIGAYSPASLSVHATELYESALGLLVCGVAVAVLFARRRKPLDGTTLFVAVVVYAIGRFAIETLRGDVDRGVFGGTAALSTSQIVSALLIVVVATVMVRRISKAHSLARLQGTS